MSRHWTPAVAAGLCGSLASVAGKLALMANSSVMQFIGIRMMSLIGLHETVYSINVAQGVIRAMWFAIMLILNGAMWTSFSKALACNPSTVEVVVVNSAVNFFCTAFFGWLLFAEPLSFLWWIGSSFIIAGVVLITVDGHAKTVTLTPSTNVCANDGNKMKTM